MPECYLPFTFALVFKKMGLYDDTMRDGVSVVLFVH